RDNVWGNLNDPVTNARAAYAISHHGTDMRPWTTTHDSNQGTSADYRTYLSQVEAVTGVQGDDRGVGGYDSPLPPPLPSSGDPGLVQPSTLTDTLTYDQIDGGMLPGANVDTDLDGLTNAFERVAGTSVREADSDHDSLSDAYELGILHSDPTAADSDHDGLSDSTEASLGTSPTSWDTDHDGMSDLVEVRYGSDPLQADAGDGTTATAGQPLLPTVGSSAGDGGPVSASFHQRPTEGYQRVELTPAAEYQHFTLDSSASSQPIVLNGRTIAMLDAADQRLGVNLAIVQGSYSTSVSASEGTHAGGGAIDVSVSGMSQEQIGRTVGALRAEGFAAWYRTTDQGFDMDHIHAVAIGDRQMSPQAADQVTAYYDGRDGLAGGLTDSMPHGRPVEFGYDEWLAGQPAPSTKLDSFIDNAVAQRGDQYIFGAEANPTDANPDAFDCSELVQWSAHQAGVEVPDGAMYQYLDLKAKGDLMPVEQALHTRGALLFYFSSEPTASGGRPSEAHVAISLGNGKTIEAKGTDYGVNEFPAEGRFNYAGVIPGLSGTAIADHAESALSTVPAQPMTAYDQIDVGDPVAPTDSDHDGLTDAFEKLAGTDPHAADSDHDSLSDAQEAIGTHTDPLSRDTDHDGRSDRFEIFHHADAGSLPGVAGVVGQGIFAENIRHGTHDDDHDSISNVVEGRLHLDPHSADSDHDGLSDSTELSLGTNPLDADTDHDGFSDAFEVQYGTDPLHAGTGLQEMPMAPGTLGEPVPGTDPLGTDPSDVTGLVDPLADPLGTDPGPQ
ncbi:MAG TPA: NlpC/P60 family protein, partial [Nocardioidaceae bacterium]